MLKLLVVLALLCLVAADNQRDDGDNGSEYGGLREVFTVKPTNTLINKLFNNSLVQLYEQKLFQMSMTANSTVIVHEHVPKAGGTALAAALSFHCACHGHETGCKNCDKVTGSDGTRFKYVVARTTGWICGVHSPLVVMRHVPCDEKVAPFSDIGIKTAIVIMLRDPWDRFVSEINKWCHIKGQCVDWSVRKRVGTNWLYFRNYTFADVTAIADAAKLPSEMMVHNRNIKMVGGEKEHFNMRFNSAADLGSRWIGSTDTDLMYQLLSESIRVMHLDNQVFPLIHERFEESLCIVESVFGGVYRFQWNPNKHSHHESANIPYTPAFKDPILPDYFTHILQPDGLDLTPTDYPKKKYLKTLRESAMREYTIASQIHNVSVNSEAFKNWLNRNVEDIIFYKYSMKIFEANFMAALSLVLKLVKSGKSEMQNYPHCRPFLKIAALSN